MDTLKDKLPCPFCGSSNLITTDWWWDDDGKYHAIACVDCNAEAPATTWNNRYDAVAVNDAMQFAEKHLKKEIS